MTFGGAFDQSSGFNNDLDRERKNYSYNMTSTASKFMNNTEAKARQFIEKQRKRTATLGTKRTSNHKKIYKVVVSSERTHSSAKDTTTAQQVPFPAAVIDLGANLEQLVSGGIAP